MRFEQDKSQVVEMSKGVSPDLRKPARRVTDSTGLQVRRNFEPWPDPRGAKSAHSDQWRHLREPYILGYCMPLVSGPMLFWTRSFSLLIL